MTTAAGSCSTNKCPFASGQALYGLSKLADQAQVAGGKR
jgi:hypothetical protein